MKKNFLNVAFCFAALSATYAQTVSSNKSVPSSLAKGSLQLGVNGTGGWSSLSRSHVISPWIGYVLQDKLVTGLAVSSSSFKSTSKDISVRPDMHRTNVSPELFARYYLMSGKLKPFVQLGAGYNFLKSGGARESGAYLSPSAGLSYWLGQRFALEANYKIKVQEEDMKQLDPEANLKFRIGFSVGIK